MKITSADFIMSNARADCLPSDGRPEYAFIGRSNVGKSSLINCLTGRKSLAMTSSTPGKTMLINHFLINKSWYIVDLPGYGYAQRSRRQRDGFRGIITHYVLERTELTCLFVLVDARIEPQRIDLNFISMLGEHGVPFAIIFTKCDKVRPAALTAAVDNYKRVLHESWEELPPLFLTSSNTGRGRDELLAYIDSINADCQEFS